MKEKKERLERPIRRAAGEYAALNAYRIELLGNREMQVDGCRGILRYDPTAVCFRVGRAVFCVYGSELVIESMTEDGMTIRGRILRTELIP